MARILLFDIDFTLIRSTGAGRRAIRDAINNLYGITDGTAGVSFDGRTDFGIWTEILSRIEQHGPDERARLTAEYLSLLPASMAAAENAVILPGVSALLDALRDAHSHIGLGTGNMRAGAEQKLAHFDLWRQFAGGGFGDDTAVRAEIIRDGIAEIAAALDIAADPADTIVIGDTPLDIEAGHTAGARVLAVATGNFTAEALTAAGADWTLPDLSDLNRSMAIFSS